MKKSELSDKEYPSYHGYYIDLMPDVGIEEALRQSESFVLSLIEPLSEKDSSFRYESEKWSIKELIIHLLDTERIFVYRALRNARNDFAKVPGFDQNVYTENSNSESRSLKSIIEEYKAQRESTIQFFSNLTSDALKKVENLDSKRPSVRAAAFFIAGHETHHGKILEERYLAALSK